MSQVDSNAQPVEHTAATVLVPVTASAEVEPRFGRAPRVAVAKVLKDRIIDWQEYAVGWDAAHSGGTEGSHHARIVRFLRAHNVDTIVAEHMGAGMVRVVGRMGIRLLATPGGDARAAVLAALAGGPAEDQLDRR
ncbi:NifB/NifX family molybdenum-iron cluster-binding protein [Actinomyces sp.]|uniref:NifB/NifX family molybdenum-iron cluster-binding protein n=1 Tax=Actinomyces sp. TaxID=29317 RepID=UPI0026DC1344|nr:NifB/NifX family molybdenum-iron cluster-binding protein [Actinomyces sp.]MDO4901231.1 NifB/NifX family molybdenum-iron cluster-binding protein [Actinomyces sp.]